MPSGRVKFFNTDRGYGFIAPDDGGSDVFVRVHDVEAAGMKILVAGQLVAYKLGPARQCLPRSVRNAHSRRQLFENAAASRRRSATPRRNSRRPSEMRAPRRP